MKRLLFLLCSTALLASCGGESAPTVKRLPQEKVALFHSTDSTLNQVFAGAKRMALSYAHDGSDPVGCWYEAALPQREAFCMRDVSHQSVGAQILGLARHNKNMFRRFAENISEAKEWCTYWEINRYNQPAPADYESDEAFWYNLNANFDVMQACLKMYDWTGDADYLNDSTFTHFYEKSVKEYIECWDLQPEKLMQRPPYMNRPEGFDLSKNFHTCRGLPSYVENFRGLTVGVDLVASLYAGFQAYAQMNQLKGDNAKAEEAMKTALAYRQLLDKEWWSEENQFYQTFWTTEKKFYRGEGVPFILWFNATDNRERIRATVKDILAREWNVENLSAFPALFYRLGYNEEAYNTLIALPHTPRYEYPEVSYGMIEGMTCGLMGLQPSVIGNSVSTCPRLPEGVKEAELKNVPAFDGYLSVKHNGNHATELTNHTTRTVTWKISFPGKHERIEADGKTMETMAHQDIKGNCYSAVEVSLPAGASLKAKALK